MKRLSRDCTGLPVLGTFLWISFVLNACGPPVSPGCGADESRPRDPEIFLILFLAADDNRGASFSVDQDGRSQFLGGRTVWMLAPLTTCKTIPREDVLQLQRAWRRAVEYAGAEARQQPDRPNVAVTYRDPGGERQRLYVKPSTHGQSSALERAVGLTAHVFQKVYGDRVQREFQAAQLAELVSKPLDEEPLNSSS